jgi:hypothetical protein
LIKDSEYSPEEIYNALSRLEVIGLDLQVQKNSLDIVQTVFEKINATGKPLTGADLIRNKLLLAKTSQEQNKLYENYWQKIERLLQTENIESFARFFLSMFLLETIKNKPRFIYDAYKKLHVQSSQEKILGKMYDYSRVYDWIVNNTCPDQKVKRDLEILALLKYDPLKPLVLYVLYELKDDFKKLNEITALFVNFLIRYRICSPSRGGGAIETAFLTILGKLRSKQIELNNESILFELSNSPTYISRYPDDQEFRAHLRQQISNDEARVILLRIEQFETKNTLVPVADVTTEHLMPQTLSEWWINVLGANYKDIHQKRINLIGNLAIVSRSYNSSMSNRQWPEKRENLKAVQFSVTQEIPGKYPKWDGKSIFDRGEDIIERAIKAIPEPLVRTRPINTREKSKSSGWFNLYDESFDATGASINAYKIDAQDFECSKFSNFFEELLAYCYIRDEKLLNVLTEKNAVHKSVSTHVSGKKDPILTNDVRLAHTGKRIKGSNIFFESKLSAQAIIQYSRQILSYYEINNVEVNLSDVTLLGNEQTLIKADAVEIVKNANVSLFDNITFAQKNSRKESYWLNPPVKYLEKDWTLILSDSDNNKLIVFSITANSFDSKQFTVRSDREMLDIFIAYNDKEFCELNGISFKPYLTNIIDF